MGYIASSCLKVSFSVGPVVRVLYQGRSTSQEGREDGVVVPRGSQRVALLGRIALLEEGSGL